MIAIAVRLATAGALLAGPWFDTEAELAGWDVERFQQLADEPGRPWVDRPVEYPPGSVALVELIAGSGPVDTHRRLVAASLAADLALAGFLSWIWGRRVAGAYLLIGLPLVAMGLVRLDLWSVAAAAVGAAALVRRRPALFASAVAVGALIKVWPALLVGAAAAIRRLGSAAAALAALAAAGVAWVAFAGWSLSPVEQVVSLRGATGWHVESVGGSLTALVTGAEPELQLNAFRIGSISQPAVVAGRAITIGVVLALCAYGRSAIGRRPAAGVGVGAETGTGAGTPAAERRAGTEDGTETTIVALVMAGATAALIVTAPLLSPQFLLWLTPWAALLLARRGGGGGRWPAATGWLVVAAVATTGLVLGAYQPPELARPVPAVLLLLRDGLLVAAVVAAIGAARQLGRRSGRAELPLGDGGAGPRPAGADPEVDEVADEARGLAGRGLG
jgi:hypothetical protein